MLEILVRDSETGTEHVVERVPDVYEVPDSIRTTLQVKIRELKAKKEGAAVPSA